MDIRGKPLTLETCTGGTSDPEETEYGQPQQVLFKRHIRKQDFKPHKFYRL